MKLILQRKLSLNVMMPNYVTATEVSDHGCVWRVRPIYRLSSGVLKINITFSYHDVFFLGTFVRCSAVFFLLVVGAWLAVTHTICLSSLDIIKKNRSAFCFHIQSFLKAQRIEFFDSAMQTLRHTTLCQK